MSDPKLFPVQALTRDRRPATSSEAVYMRAYEVYAHVHGPQEAMIDHARGCRGGFSSGELIAFLYAHSFPKAEWRQRCDEAFAGLHV